MGSLAAGVQRLQGYKPCMVAKGDPAASSTHQNVDPSFIALAHELADAAAAVTTPYFRHAERQCYILQAA